MKTSEMGARIVDKRKAWEARVEMAIFKLPKDELSTYDKLVYAILCGHANRDGNAMLYVRTIAEEASCSDRQVRRALSSLEAHRLLIRHPQSAPGQGKIFNIYEIYGFEEYISPATLKPRDEGTQTEDGQIETGQKSDPCHDEDQPDNPQLVSHAQPISHPQLVSHALTVSHDFADSQSSNLPVSHNAYVSQAGHNNVFKQLLKNIKEKETPPTPPGEKVEGEGVLLEGQKQHGTDEKAKGTKTSGAEFFELVLNAYNTALPELPRAEKVTASRAKIIKQRIEEDAERRRLSWWKQFFSRVRSFPWPMGDNPNKWRANFDWLIGEKGMQKILEGGFGRASTLNFGAGMRVGWELQKKYTDEGGRVNGKAILREIQASQVRR
jgi:hypothetical protein